MINETGKVENNRISSKLKINFQLNFKLMTRKCFINSRFEGNFINAKLIKMKELEWRQTCSFTVEHVDDEQNAFNNLSMFKGSFKNREARLKKATKQEIIHEIHYGKQGVSNNSRNSFVPRRITFITNAEFIQLELHQKMPFNKLWMASLFVH